MLIGIKSRSSMRQHLRSAAIVFLLSGVALAVNELLPNLKARADAAHGADQAKLCLEYAHRLLEDANTLFTNGDVDKAQGEIAEVVEYSRKAADAASTSGKHLKQSEIELRKLSKRMHDIAETLAVEDRPPVLKAVEDIEEVRSDLLAKMFGPQAEPKGKP
jgi:tetratricopeptide (TPR) repeat protein